VRTIKEGSQTQRREALNDSSVRSALQTYPYPNLASVIAATLLEGEQSWQAFGAGVVNFYTHFVDRGQNTPLPYTATMNCWDMVLYAAFIAGKISGEDIRKFYRIAQSMGGGYEPKYWETLKWFESLPYFTGYSIAGGTQREPDPGDLLFFRRRNRNPWDSNIPTHIAFSIGGRQAISLADRPNQNKTIQRITVDQLYYDQYGDALIQVGRSITRVIADL
jgi:hypothetical protein